MNNLGFWKTMENVRKYRDIKLITTERRKYYLVNNKLSYCKVFYGKFINNRNEKNSGTYELAFLFRFINIRPE